MLDVLEACRAMPERRLLFAKMDEMVRSGPVLSAAISSQIPTSYLAVGARVPGDIEAGNLNKLVEKIVGYGPKKRK
jgi:flagellar biosynthesis GTPase FlhF